MYSDVAPADHGPVFPADPTGGQLWYLTATVGENDPGIYVYDLDTTAWAAFVDNSVAPGGTTS